MTVVLLVMWPAPAPAQGASEAGGERELIWPDHYNEVHWFELVGAGLFLGGTLLVEQLIDPSFEPRWEGGILFDNAARDLFVADRASVRDAANVASDVVWLGGAAYPLFDAVIAAGLVHHR